MWDRAIFELIYVIFFNFVSPSSYVFFFNFVSPCNPNPSTYFLDLAPNLVSWHRPEPMNLVLVSGLEPESMNLVSRLRPGSMRFIDLRKFGFQRVWDRAIFELIYVILFIFVRRFSSILLVRVTDPNPFTYFLDLAPILVSWLRPEPMNLVLVS